MKYKTVIIMSLLFAVLLVGIKGVTAEEDIEVIIGWDPHMDRPVVKSHPDIPTLEPTITLDYVKSKIKYHFLFDNGEQTLEVNLKESENRIRKDGRESRKMVYTVMNTKRDGKKEPNSAVKKELHIRISDRKAVQKLVNQETGKTEIKYKYNRETGKTKVWKNGKVIKVYNGYAALLLESNEGNIKWYGLE
ncbi:MAG: hypothetical protein Q8Q42_01285 [Nanoarchaeota archaeon]|nr:hypothetical protein [Nanoarchaeota archaeon]